MPHASGAASRGGKRVRFRVSGQTGRHRAPRARPMGVGRLVAIAAPSKHVGDQALADHPAGTAAHWHGPIHTQESHMQFGEFYILGRWRNGGLGSEILRRALAIADDRHLETRLEYLKWNPVASLYGR